MIYLLSGIINMGGLVKIAVSNSISGAGMGAATAVASLGIGVLLAASVAGQLANEWLEAEKARIEAAQREYAEKRQTLHEQQVKQEGYQAIHAALEQLKLTTPQAHSGLAKTGLGFLATSSRQQKQKQLAALAEAMESIPPSWRQTHTNIWADLQRQLQGQQSQPNSQILTAMQKNLHSILGQALEEVSQQQQWVDEAHALFYELEPLQEAAPAHLKSDYQALLSEIQDGLTNSSSRLQKLVAWREQSTKLRQQTREWQEQTAVRHALIERIKFHLDSKGYIYIGKGRFRMPKGEQIQVQFNRRGEMSIRLIHERAQTTLAPLSTDEYAFFQQQEQDWHQDLEQMMLALNADGFPIEISHHETVAVDAVSLAFLDRADQWYQDAERAQQPYSNQL